MANSASGIRLILRQPGIALMEIAWRWSFGLAAIILLVVGWAQFAASLTVTPDDLAALHSGRPTMVAVALLHIFQGTGPRLLRAALIIFPALCLLWWVAASVGRTVTLQRISTATDFGSARRNVPAIFSNHLLRAFFAVATLSAAFCGVFLAALASVSFSGDPEEPNTLLYFLILLLILPVLLTVWGTLNWYLSLAPWFSMSEGQGAFVAIASARTATRAHRRALWGVSFGYGLARLGILIGLIIFAALVAAFSSSAGGWRTALVITALASLVYFALADFLYVARLAAYIGIVKNVPQKAEPLPASDLPAPSASEPLV